jgi:Cytochrome c2
MDSFEFNKIAGTVLGTLLFAMGLGFVAEGIFHVEAPEQPGYVIEVADEGAAAGGEEEAEQPITALLASADVGKGEGVAKKCAACHDFTKGGPNKTGPNLWGVLGRTPGTHEGFGYSGAMVEFGKSHTWNFETLSDFIHNPKADVPGTSMGFAGIKKPDERANLLVYLHSLSDAPEPLPTE